MKLQKGGRVIVTKLIDSSGNSNFLGFHGTIIDVEDFLKDEPPMFIVKFGHYSIASFWETELELLKRNDKK